MSSTEWRQPVDLVALCERAPAELPTLFTVGRDRGPWLKHAELAGLLLGDDPGGIIDALKTAISDGAAFADVGRSLCYAAALRIARFGTANEDADWETAHHVFTYCNASASGAEADRLCPSFVCGVVESMRAVLHGAIAIYLTRYLNVPPARLPAEGDDGLKELPSTVEEIRAAMLDAFDRQHRVDEAALLVARHLTLGHQAELMIATLAHALLREDAGFHGYQIFEAGVRQFHEWADPEPKRNILIAVARYLAAHSPTERAWLPASEVPGAEQCGLAKNLKRSHAGRKLTLHRFRDGEPDVVSHADFEPLPPVGGGVRVLELCLDPHLPTAHFDWAGRHVIRPEIERAATRKIEPGMVPVAGQNAVLHASAIEGETHMRASVVKGVHATLVTDDQDGSMRSPYYEPPFGIELRKRACTHEFGVHDHASSRNAALGRIAECGQ